jgi:hypothetical protein
MDWVWKLKGPGAGAAGTSPFSERADSVDMLLAGRRISRGVLGLRKAALFLGEGSRPPMSFQLAVLLVALERETGRSKSASSRSISISASGSRSSGGGSTSRGGVGEGGGTADDRPEAMCLSRTRRWHGDGGGTPADLPL